MYIIRYILLILVILSFWACEKDYSPTKPDDTGDISIVFADAGKSVSDSLNSVPKAAKPAAMTRLEVRVLQSDNELLVSKTFTPSDGVFNVRMSVTAQENLKVLCLGMFDGAVGYFGIDEDVDVVAGQSTTAVISGWNDSYLSYIGEISPNPSTDGNYSVSWTEAPNATTYVLQEATNESFAGASTAYSGSSLQYAFSAKSSGTYFYRVQASNIYNVNSSWSDVDSVTVQEMYTISGTIAAGGGATVTLSGSASDTQTADGTGHFSFTVSKGGTYTVTPVKQDYTITPESMTFENITADQTATFTASNSPAVTTYIISGTVTGADSVSIILSGDASDTQTVNSGGTYSFTVNAGGDYIVNPSKAGYAFSPANKTFAAISSNHKQDFAGTALLNFTISGKISGADSVSIILSGDATIRTQTVNDGETYSFTVTEGGNYTVTPSKSGHTITPASQTFENVTSNQNQNFAATLSKCTISGKITNADDVTVALSGDDTDSIVVKRDDSYFFTVEWGRNYTVTPTKQGYTFIPPSRTFNNINSNKTFMDFKGEVDITQISMINIPSGTFSMGDIQGTVDSDELPVHNVTISSFEMSQYEITNAQYVSYLNEALISGPIIATSTTVEIVVGVRERLEYLDLDGLYCDIIYSDGVFSIKNGKENHPVKEVSWYGAKAFAEYYGYDLPTEAEWEYACRAGTKTIYNTGESISDLDRAGWYGNNNEGWSSPVGSKEPNAWGLYDMHGNVWEWCNDWYDPEYYTISPLNDPTGPLSGTSRIKRGGSWYSNSEDCKSSTRQVNQPTYSGDLGFRVVRRP